MRASRLVPALALALIAPGLRADTVRLTNGKEVTGKIVSESFEKIEVRKAGGSSSQTVSTVDVASVEYTATTPEWRQGLQLLADGSMGEAASAFATVADDPDAPDFLRAAAFAQAGDCLVDNNNFEDAIKLYDELLAKHPKTRHLARALLGKGTSLFSLRKLAEADKVLEQLKADATAKNLGERWALEAEFLLLWSAEAQEKPGVIEGYQALREKTRASLPGIANKAALRMGRVQLAQQDVKAAEALFDEIIQRRLDTDASIVAGAFNGRGQCRFGRAIGLLGVKRADEALPLFSEALLDFLRVVVSYSGVRKEQAEALYFAGQSFLNVAALDPNAKDAESRGQVLLKRCREQYAGSEWAAKAAAQR